MQIRLDLDELERELGTEAQELIEEIANELINQLIIHSPAGATGDLRRSWDIWQTTDGEVILGSRLGYAHYVDTGTQPRMFMGAMFAQAPPFKPIKLYARRVIGDEGAAGKLWTKIIREGTDASPYIDDSVDAAIDRTT